MIKVNYVYEAMLYIQLNDEDFELVDKSIINYSQTEHYAEFGQFWYGNRNSRNWFKDNKEDEIPSINCTTRQLDTVILKSLEYARIGDPKAAGLFSRLFAVLRDTIHSLNDIQSKFKTLEYK